MESTNNKSRALFEKCIGALIFLNILHQIISSMDLREYQNILAYGDLFYQISMVIFLGEIIYRFFTEKQLGFLNGVDSLVLINFYFIGILDLRIFRLLDSSIYSAEQGYCSRVILSLRLFMFKDIVY